MNTETKTFREVPMISQYFAEVLHTDVNPYEVVRKVNHKTYEVRAMNAELDPSWKPEVMLGGFAGHVVNQHEQKWTFSSDPTARVIRIRLHKDGWWRSAGGNRFRPTAAPRKFHDYNF